MYSSTEFHTSPMTVFGPLEAYDKHVIDWGAISKLKKQHVFSSCPMLLKKILTIFMNHQN